MLHVKTKKKGERQCGFIIICVITRSIDDGLLAFLVFIMCSLQTLVWVCNNIFVKDIEKVEDYANGRCQKKRRRSRKRQKKIIDFFSFRIGAMLMVNCRRHLHQILLHHQIVCLRIHCPFPQSGCCCCSPSYRENHMFLHSLRLVYQETRTPSVSVVDRRVRAICSIVPSSIQIEK